MDGRRSGQTPRPYGLEEVQAIKVLGAHLTVCTEYEVVKCEITQPISALRTVLP